MSDYWVGTSLMFILQPMANIVSLSIIPSDLWALSSISLSVYPSNYIIGFLANIKLILLGFFSPNEHGSSTLISVILATLIFILCVSGCIYRSFWIKRKANRLLEEKTKKILQQKEELTAKALSLEKTNDELRELSQFKESLIHMIAHDMKNPLNAIIGLSSVGMSEKNQKVILQSGHQILNMVNNMLEVQKFEEATMTLNEGDHDFKELYEKAIFPLGLLIEEKRLITKLVHPPGLKVHVDGDLVSRVLANILSNAVKYSKQDSSIDVQAELYHSGEWVLVSVTDYGQGIPSDQLACVFNAYWKGESSNTKAGNLGSTGLGLTFCKLVLDAHDCDISVSSSEGKFTTFRFSLPTSTAHDVSPLMDSYITQHLDPGLVLESETELLSKYFKELSKIKIHQIGRIRMIIQELDEMGIQSKWKAELAKAAYSANETLFYSLINMIKLAK